MTTTTTSTQAQGQRTAWAIDPSHTLVELAVRHMMIANVKGRFTDVSGTIETDGDDPTTARIDVTIAAASIDTREEKRDAHLKSADFLDVESFPEITFRSTNVDRTGQDTLEARGDLTIHGVTKPVVLLITENGRGRDPWGGERAGFSATAQISRKDFGLEWNVALETGGVLVGDKVRISIETEVVKQS
jgi:polyisoprenoid-binding protein YceI